MRQAGYGLDLRHKLVVSPIKDFRPLGDDFDGRRRSQPLVSRLPNLAEAASRDRADERVATELSGF